MPYLEVTEVVLIHCNVVNNNYQQKSRVLYIFVPNKFGQLLDISPKNFIFLKTFDSELSYIEVWFTDQNFNALEIEDTINITLVVNYSITYKNDTLFCSTKRHNICKKLQIFVFCYNYGKCIIKKSSSK